MKERLIKLLDETMSEQYEKMMVVTADHTADHLLANGVIVPPCKPISVMSDGNEFNSDVYCPYCGTNLSGLYGEEPTSVIQCYSCGEFLDNTKTITKEEAEKALENKQ